MASSNYILCITMEIADKIAELSSAYRIEIKSSKGIV